MTVISYSLSAGNWGDGKSVCLWRHDDKGFTKIARFQSDLSARQFAEEHDFPLSDRLRDRLYKEEKTNDTCVLMDNR